MAVKNNNFKKVLFLNTVDTLDTLTLIPQKTLI